MHIILLCMEIAVLNGRPIFVVDATFGAKASAKVMKYGTVLQS